MIQPKATLLLFAGLISTALAAQNTTQEFHVRSQVISGPAKFSNLYLSAYHTGAGMNDIALTGKNTASKAYFNSTQLQWDLGTPDFPWGLSLTTATNYVAWSTTTMGSGYGDTGVSLSSGVSGENSITVNSQEWAGWIACDWWHGVPQLFYQYGGTKYPLPPNCATIALFPEYI